MKRILKYFPLALAAFALASCSNDDLFGSDSSQEEKGALTVNVAPLIDGDAAITRAGNIASNNALDWQNGDQINVYDEDLSRFDEYAFDATANNFGLKDPSQAASNMRNPMKYALFPADRVDYHGWNPSEGAKAVIRIPERIDYTAATEYNTDNGIAYVSNLPLYGTTRSGSTFGNVEVDLSWLTAVLRIQLNDAFANISYLKIETDPEHPITGAFEALLEAATPALQVGTNALENGNVMYIDVRKVPAALSYIYIPVVAGNYQKFTVSTAALAGNENVEDPSSFLPADWTVLRNLTTGFTFNTGTIYRITKAYDLTSVTTCELLSKALKQYKTVDGIAGKLSLAIGGGTGLIESRNSDVDTDNTIWIPKMKATTLELDITTKIENQVGGGAANVPLVIADEDYTNPYEGTVIIKTPLVTSMGAGAGHIDIQVKMPKATVQFVGADFSTTKANTLTVDAAKNIVFGDGSVATTIGQADGDITLTNVETVTVKNAAHVGSIIDVEDTQNILYVDVQTGGTATKVYVKDAAIYVTGTINEAIDSYTSGRTYIGYNAAGTAGQGNGQIGTLRTFGDVYIANVNESEAITTELDLYANNNVYLLQGYVKKIDYNTGGYPANTYQQPQTLANLPAADLKAKEVNVYLDQIQGEGLTAIAEIDAKMLNYIKDGVTYNFVKLSESKWGGKAIGGGTGTTAADQIAWRGAYAAADKLDKIYTASELASIDIYAQATAIVMYNDIDLNNQTWTPQTHNADFDGADPRYNATAGTHPHGTKMAQYHTIKNLKFANIIGVTTYGLFKDITPGANVTIKNFKVNGVSTALNANATLAINGVGIVAGTVTNSVAARTLTFDNIKINQGTNNIGTAVTGVNYVAPAFGLAVGGMIGKAVLTTATDNALVIRNSAVVLNEIKGHAYVGGLVGQIEDAGAARTAKVDLLTGNTVAVTKFTQLGQPTDLDLTYFQFGTYGLFVGTAKANELKVPFVALTDATKAKLMGHANKGALGFKYNHFTEAHVLYRVAGGCPEVGFSADMATKVTTLDNLTVGTYVYPAGNLDPKFAATNTAAKAYICDDGTAPYTNNRFNVYLKNSQWDLDVADANYVAPEAHDF